MRLGSAVLGIVSLCAIAAPAGAQEAIRMGETRQGTLDSGDLKLDDNSYYDMYKYLGKAGETIQVVMRSSAFDAFISFGQMNGSSFNQMAFDDDGGGNTDSRLVVTLPSDGVYLVRANSVKAEATGAYTLSLSPGDPSDAASLSGGADEGPLPDPVAIRIGQTVQGELSNSDAKMSDDSYYDLYSFEATAGQHLIITMRSSDFDSYLSFGTVSDGSFSTLETDDDHGGGKDALIEYDVTADGTFYVRANSLFADSTGRYSLTVETGKPRPKVEATVQPIRIGQTKTSTLDDSDARLDDDSYYELWTFTGHRGDHLTITMKSPDFDAYLAYGRMDHGEFSSIDNDDDGAGGTDARLQVTLSADGEYVIRANTLSQGETGRYTLSLTRGGAGGAAPGKVESVLPTPIPIRIGQTVQGQLSESDAKADDDSYYDLYTVSAPRGEGW